MKKILLLGDYSSVHFNLYHALRKKRHDVTLVSSGDGYKNIPTQFSWKSIGINKTKIKNDTITKFLNENHQARTILTGNEIVQIINPIFVEELSPNLNSELFDYIKNNNKRIYLYSCGDDYYWVKNSIPPSNYFSMFKNPRLYFSKELWHPMKYIINPTIRQLCIKVYNDVEGIIPGSLDYDWSIPDSNKKKNIIPFPIITENIKFEKIKFKDNYKIIHGYQPGKKIRKGDECFNIEKNSLANYTYSKIGGIPYTEYLEAMKNCDIFFDQANSSDQGMNALIAMAMGKLVFSGFSKRFLSHYDINGIVGFDVHHDKLNVLNILQKIINNEINVEEISLNARSFIETYHDSSKVADSFVNTWNSEA